MISYLKKYITLTEYNHLIDVLDKNILKNLEINQLNVEINLEYFKENKLNIALLLEYRPDLILNDYEVVKDSIEKNIKYLRKLNPKDYILFGI